MRIEQNNYLQGEEYVRNVTLEKLNKGVVFLCNEFFSFVPPNRQKSIYQSQFLSPEN
jgi:hypothetical protein